MTYDINKWCVASDWGQRLAEDTKAVFTQMEELFDKTQPNYTKGLQLVDLPEPVEAALEEALRMQEALHEKVDWIGGELDKELNTE